MMMRSLLLSLPLA